MGTLIVFGAIVIVAGGLFLFGAARFRQGWADKRVVKQHEQEVAEADSTASWRVSVHHTGANTLVTVQRQTWPPAAVRYFGDPVVVARIPQDSPGYEVELDRASTTARQRAAQLNRLREEVPQ